MVAMAIPPSKKQPWLDRLMVSSRQVVPPFLCLLVGAVLLLELKSLDQERSSSRRATSHEVVQLRSRLPVGDSDVCRYFLAESALPHGGLGLFAAVGIPRGHRVGMDGDGDFCIHITDPPAYTMIDSHTWHSSNFFGQFEGASSYRGVRAACEGLATLVNTMPVTGTNTQLHTMRSIRVPDTISRQSSPAAGAMTYYHGVTATATDHIVAGSELTVDYGDWDWEADDDSYLKKAYQKPMRPVSWLQQNGWCVDNIVIGTATDPIMGRGAFTTRFLKKGTVVAPAPLQLFANRSLFSTQQPEALFVNYCWQVPGTDMLLYPYGPAVNAVNHGRANVALQWASAAQHPTLQLTKELLEDVSTAHDFWQQARPGKLLLELVALRDLQPGEELFLDYGAAWQMAWQRHVAKWQPPPTTSSYQYPSLVDESRPIRTVLDQEGEPYADNLATVCSTPVRKSKRARAKQIVWSETHDDDFPSGLVYCHVLERYTKSGVEHGDQVYKVLLNFGTNYTDFDPAAVENGYIDIHVPRRAIRFVDKPYHGDQHLPNAFRHPMGFPAELVPKLWKNGEF
jgi:hypothetical protein